MAGDTQITVVGNLTADPELRFTNTGAQVVSFTIASTPRTFDRATNEWKDGNSLFLNCSAWRDLADNIAASLTKGMRVIAQGRLNQRSYQAQDGTNRTVVELTVDEIGPALSRATAQVTKKAFSGGSNASASASFASAPAASAPAAPAAAPAPVQDPWATEAATTPDVSDPADLPF